MGALGILLGVHYLPLTQLALKAGASTLGGMQCCALADLSGRAYMSADLSVVAVTEFASRSFGVNTFLSRLRPKAYKKIPESTLNATLKDIHDLIQYSVDQGQRIIFGQDLGKTFAVGCRPRYGLARNEPSADARAGFLWLHRHLFADQSRIAVFVIPAKPHLGLRCSPGHFAPRP